VLCRPPGAQQSFPLAAFCGYSPTYQSSWVLAILIWEQREAWSSLCHPYTLDKFCYHSPVRVYFFFFIGPLLTSPPDLPETPQQVVFHLVPRSERRSSKVPVPMQSPEFLFPLVDLSSRRPSHPDLAGIASLKIPLQNPQSMESSHCQAFLFSSPQRRLSRAHHLGSPEAIPILSRRTLPSAARFRSLPLPQGSHPLRGSQSILLDTHR